MLFIATHFKAGGNAESAEMRDHTHMTSAMGREKGGPQKADLIKQLRLCEMKSYYRLGTRGRGLNMKKNCGRDMCMLP